MMRITTTILVLLFLTACIDSRDTPLVQLDAAQSQMAEHADSAKSILEAIDRTSIRTRNGKARFALLYSQALDKNYIDVDQDTLIRIATNYYDRKGNVNDRAQAFFYSGRVYENAGIIDTAIMQYSKAEEFSKSSNNTYLKGLIANALAGLYATQQFNTLARDKFIESANYFQQLGNNRNAMRSYRGAISQCIHAKNYALAREYVDIIIDLAVEANDTEFLKSTALLSASIAINQDHDYRKALKILQNASEKYAENRMPKNYYFTLSQIYLNLNKLDSAYFYLEPEIVTIGDETSRGKAEINYLAGKIIQQKGNYKEAYNYAHNALSMIDSLYFTEKDSSIPELKEKYHNEQLQIRNRYLNKLNRYQFVIAFLICVGIISLAGWLIKKRHDVIAKQNQEIQEHKDIIKRLQSEYEQIKAIQENVGENEATAYLHRKLERRMDFVKNMLDTTATFEGNKEAYYDRMKHFITSRNTSDDNDMLLVIRDMLDSRQPGILNYLQECHPSLSTTEMDLYCLVCLGVSISSICLVLGNKPKTIYNYRNQLRGKLNLLNESVTFEQHFAMLCAEFIEKQS